MDERDAAQATELIRELRNQLHEMIHRLVRLERQDVSQPLEWIEAPEDWHHAYRDKAHYGVYKRSDGKWGVPVFSLFTEPDQAEQKLGEYVATTLEDGKEIAQALADQRERFG
jgi:hypothetical protein